MYDHTLVYVCIYQQSSQKLKKAVSVVIADSHFNLPRGLCVYMYGTKMSLTLSSLKVDYIGTENTTHLCLKVIFLKLAYKCSSVEHHINCVITKMYLYCICINSKSLSNQDFTVHLPAQLVKIIHFTITNRNLMSQLNRLTCL